MEQQAASDGKALALVDALDRGHQALAAAVDNFQVFKVRQGAEAFAAAAKVLERRDIEVKASHLISDAERVLATANPPQEPTFHGNQHTAPKGGASLPEGGTKPTENNEETETAEKLETEAETRRMGRLIANARQAHADLPDEKYEELKQESEKAGEPLTRQAIRKATIQHRRDTGQAPAPRKQAAPAAVPDPAPATQVDDRESMRKRITELEAQVTDLEEEVQARKYAETSEKRISALKAERDALKHTNATLQRENGTLKRQVKALEKKVRALEK